MEIIQNPTKVGTGLPYSYEIENSKQFLIISGESHEELRVIVESFLQANSKIRSKYKCCVLHNCVQENEYTLDTYYIVKNIMRQILHTLPFLRQYLMISDNAQFKWVINELFDKPSGADVLQQNFEPDIFVKFIKRIN